MIGVPEILILAVVILLVVFWKRIPELGRSAGDVLKTGVDKARGLSSTVGAKVDEKVDPAAIGRSAGRTAREVREVRDAFTGKETPKDEKPGTGPDSA